MQNKNQILIWGLVFLVFAGVASFLIMGQVSASLQDDENDPFYPAELEEIEYLQGLLESGNLDEQAQKSVQEKLEMAQRIATQQVEAAMQPPQAADMMPAPKTIDDPAFRTGIFEGGEGVFRAQEAIIENHWQAIIADQYIQVFAGVSGADNNQGIVIMITAKEDKMDPVFQTIYSPGENGSLRVIAENDLILDIQAADGSTFQFSIAEGRFLP